MSASEIDRLDGEHDLHAGTEAQQARGSAPISAARCAGGDRAADAHAGRAKIDDDLEPVVVPVVAENAFRGLPPGRS